MSLAKRKLRTAAHECTRLTAENTLLRALVAELRSENARVNTVARGALRRVTDLEAEARDAHRFAVERFVPTMKEETPTTLRGVLEVAVEHAKWARGLIGALQTENARLTAPRSPSALELAEALAQAKGFQERVDIRTLLEEHDDRSKS